MIIALEIIKLSVTFINLFQNIAMFFNRIKDISRWMLQSTVNSDKVYEIDFWVLQLVAQEVFVTNRPYTCEHQESLSTFVFKPFRNAMDINCC